MIFCALNFEPRAYLGDCTAEKHKHSSEATSYRHGDEVSSLERRSEVERGDWGDRDYAQLRGEQGRWVKCEVMRPG